MGSNSQRCYPFDISSAITSTPLSLEPVLAGIRLDFRLDLHIGSLSGLIPIHDLKWKVIADQDDQENIFISS